MKNEENKFKIRHQDKPITEPLNPVPLRQQDNQDIGNLEIDIKVTSIQGNKDFSENTVNSFTGSALTVFDGTAWETELVWMLAQVMKDQFKLDDDKIRGTFKEVLKKFKLI